ncbi:MAG: hypothetical protein EBT86_01040 [Actinobacteria bacterium]|nr:hypothetical protein [Actinomycetota bacterium]
MPNLKGGSGYKRKKKGGGLEDKITIADMEEDQIFGRVVKILGNCNMLVYCEDSRERICHIRGKMRSRMFVHIGDIVIISKRDFEKVEPGKLPRGDICHKYDTKHHSALRRKFPDINPDLFANMDLKNGKRDEEGEFEFEGEAEDAGDQDSNDEEENSDESDSDENLNQNKNKKSSKSAVELAAAAAASAPSGALGGSRRKHMEIMENDDDINIDDI